MRQNITVTYELNIINEKGEEMIETFSQIFDSELYNDDIEGIDVLVVNFKLQDLKEKYGHILMTSFSIGRELNTMH